MNFLENLRRRAEGRGNVNNCSFIVPRLESAPDDSYSRIGLDGGNEEGMTFHDSECLVGRFCPYYKQANLLALADEDGYVIIQDTAKKGKTSVLFSFRAHENAIFDLTWMTSHNGNLNIVTASGDKTVAIWNAETFKRECVMYNHDQSLRTVCAHPDIPGFLVSGGRDGKICIMDNRCDLAFPVGKIIGAHAKQEKKKNGSTKKINCHNQSVTSLALRDEYCLISGGFTDGLVKVWDLRRTYSEQPLRQPAPLHCLRVGATVTSLVLPLNGVHFYASCTNNAIFCFDAINFSEKPVCKFMGHSTNSSYSSYMQASVSACGELLASGSTDGDVYVWPTRPWSVEKEEDEKVLVVRPVVSLQAHSDEVTCVQWSPCRDDLKLVSLSDDATHRIWRIGQVPDIEEAPESYCGVAKILEPLFFKPQPPKEFHVNKIPSLTHVPQIDSLPSFVHDPDSVVHKCSPRVPKQHTNWLTALSPHNKIPSAGKVVKPKRPPTKRKSSKKLHLLSPHFKAVSKPRPTKL